MRLGTPFSKSDERTLVLAIEAAELRTSAELRIHIERRCPGYELDRAAELFEALSMHRTEARNGVLIYLAWKDRKFGIIGDLGIHQHVGDAFWDGVYAEARAALGRGAWVEGLRLAVDEAGKVLSAHFPRQLDDVNELPDAISWGW